MHAAENSSFDIIFQKRIFPTIFQIADPLFSIKKTFIDNRSNEKFRSNIWYLSRYILYWFLPDVQSNVQSIHVNLISEVQLIHSAIKFKIKLSSGTDEIPSFLVKYSINILMKTNVRSHYKNTCPSQTVEKFQSCTSSEKTNSITSIYLHTYKNSLQLLQDYRTFFVRYHLFINGSTNLCIFSQYILKYWMNVHQLMKTTGILLN